MLDGTPAAGGIGAEELLAGYTLEDTALDDVPRRARLTAGASFGSEFAHGDRARLEEGGESAGRGRTREGDTPATREGTASAKEAISLMRRRASE